MFLYLKSVSHIRTAEGGGEGGGEGGRTNAQCRHNVDIMSTQHHIGVTQGHVGVI